jgi:hypothetical protein
MELTSVASFLAGVVTWLQNHKLVDASVVTAALTFVAGLAWAGLQLMVRWVRFHVSSPLVRCSIGMKAIDDALRQCGPGKNYRFDLYCLVVRFGTDDYIERIASDQERYEGRLQNHVIHIDEFETQGEARAARFNLPVHRRLGTQFKLFIKAQSPAEAVELAKLPCFHLPGADGEPARGNDADGDKIWFFHPDFPTVRTVEKLANNMFYPSRLRQFTDTSMFGGTTFGTDAVTSIIMALRLGVARFARRIARRWRQPG